MALIRVLFLADTHLGFDMPLKPRVERRRRGPDFFANFERALGPALRGEVDCVVHGGDILFRSRVRPGLVDMAFEPLRRVARAGVPVVLVPGNHERSVIPYRLLASDPAIHIFDRAQSYLLELKNHKVLFAGFPYHRRNIRRNFQAVLAETEWRRHSADLKLLCIHHCVEGATVGPGNYIFRHADDVIRIADLPGDFAAALSGHIHRHQVLEFDLKGRTVPCRVFYPGSIERTSFAEKREDKGYLLMTFDGGQPAGKALRDWQFVTLPTRPMISLNLSLDNLSANNLKTWFAAEFGRLDPDAIVKIDVSGIPNDEQKPVLTAPALRELLPVSFSVQMNFKDIRHHRMKSRQTR